MDRLTGGLPGSWASSFSRAQEFVENGGRFYYEKCSRGKRLTIAYIRMSPHIQYGATIYQPGEDILERIDETTGSLIGTYTRKSVYRRDQQREYAMIRLYSCPIVILDDDVNAFDRQRMVRRAVADLGCYSGSPANRVNAKSGEWSIRHPRSA